MNNKIKDLAIEAGLYVDLKDEPTHSLIHIVFDGTDAHIDTVVKQFETFLKAAGYNFDYLEVVKKPG
jgi:hypothetical protein